MSETAADSARESLTDALVRTSFTVIAILSQTAAAHELSLTQLRLVAILRDHEPKMAELASYLGLDRSSVSGLIDRAAARGLVRRSASADDGRAVRVSITPDGRRLATRIARQLAGPLGKMTEKLGAADQARLNALLSTMLG